MSQMVLYHGDHVSLVGWCWIECCHQPPVKLPLQVLYEYKPSPEFKEGTEIGARIELFKGGSGPYPEFYVTRILDDKTFTVMSMRTDSEVARITLDFSLGKRDIWTCTVPEGVDEVLMVATTILIDEVLEAWVKDSPVEGAVASYIVCRDLRVQRAFVAQFC